MWRCCNAFCNCSADRRVAVDYETTLLSLLPNVGPVIAERIIAKFGRSNVLDVLNSDHAVGQLSRVDGLGWGSAKQIKADWSKHSGDCLRKVLYDNGLMSVA
jgi:hypothetical protein